ncbi:hypothetical protein PR048_018448 [Dryococelus australis]|uniref:Uncharacterized protein n=1 Tax=Dryococelus australis TaxID=614101 RepID=A0ABQ9HCF9_9NEOP|nr:hypothetical protein PR048_018448 [Dryococelus australis]
MGSEWAVPSVGTDSSLQIEPGVVVVTHPPRKGAAKWPRHATLASSRPPTGPEITADGRNRRPDQQDEPTGPPAVVLRGCRLANRSPRADWRTGGVPKVCWSGTPSCLRARLEVGSDSFTSVKAVHDHCRSLAVKERVDYLQEIRMVLSSTSPLSAQDVVRVLPSQSRRVKREILEKTLRPAASYGTILTCENAENADHYTTAAPISKENVSMEQRQNEGARKTGDPRENPSTNGIVGHDSHLRNSGVNRQGINPVRLGRRRTYVVRLFGGIGCYFFSQDAVRNGKRAWPTARTKEVRLSSGVILPEASGGGFISPRTALTRADSVRRTRRILLLAVAQPFYPCASAPHEDTSARPPRSTLRTRQATYAYRGGNPCQETCVVAERDWAAMAAFVAMTTSLKSGRDLICFHGEGWRWPNQSGDKSLWWEERYNGVCSPPPPTETPSESHTPMYQLYSSMNIKEVGSGSVFHVHKNAYRCPGCITGHGDVVARLLASHLGYQGSIPGGVAPGLSHVGIMPNDVTGQRVFSGVYSFPSSFILTLLHTHLASHSSALKPLMLRAAQISSPTQSLAHVHVVPTLAFVLCLGPPAPQSGGAPTDCAIGGWLDFSMVCRNLSRCFWNSSSPWSIPSTFLHLRATVYVSNDPAVDKTRNLRTRGDLVSQGRTRGRSATEPERCRQSRPGSRDVDQSTKVEVTAWRRGATRRKRSVRVNVGDPGCSAPLSSARPPALTQEVPLCSRYNPSQHRRMSRRPPAALFLRYQQARGAAYLAVERGASVEIRFFLLTKPLNVSHDTMYERKHISGEGVYYSQYITYIINANGNMYRDLHPIDTRSTTETLHASSSPCCMSGGASAARVNVVLIGPALPFLKRAKKSNVRTETLHAMRVGAMRHQACVLVSPVSTIGEMLQRVARSDGRSPPAAPVRARQVPFPAWRSRPRPPRSMNVRRPSGPRGVRDSEPRPSSSFLTNLPNENDPVGTPRPRSRGEGAIRARPTRTPSASSLIRAARVDVAGDVTEASWEGKREISEKTRRPARIRERPHRESSPVRLGGRRSRTFFFPPAQRRSVAVRCGGAISEEKADVDRGEAVLSSRAKVGLTGELAARWRSAC